MTDIWQKCPVCEGTGVDLVKKWEDNVNRLGSTNETNVAAPVCTVCKGEKMVSRITGRPPQKV
jgi:hypothetical protein